jgi:hypothetical protein
MTASTTDEIPADVPAPILANLAEGIHLAHGDPSCAPPAAMRLISLTTEGHERLAVGFWDLPDGAGHRSDPLVGFRAPPGWAGAGLVTSGPMVTVMLRTRGGQVVSFIGEAGHPGPPILERPEGVVPDVLARVLGVATPAPRCTTATFVDLTWLERVVTARRPRPGRPRSWRWLADHHPLRGTGPTPSPSELADRTRRYGEDRTWQSFLERHRATPLPAAVWGPPGGEVLVLSEWFDEGSISRWVLRHLPPPDLLLGELLNSLSASLAHAVLDALAETDRSAAPPV